MVIDLNLDDEAAKQDDERPPQFGDDQPPKFVTTTDDGANTYFSVVERDVDEAASISEQPSAAERREIVCDIRAPFAGWRAHDFGSGGIV